MRWPLVPSVPKLAYATVNVTAPIGSCGNHATATQCFVKNVPPASRCIIHTICRFLQSCSNTWWMICFWWQLAHNITIHIMRLSLKKGCSEITVEKIPTFAGCLLATHPKSWSRGSRRIGLYLILLLVLETSQYPSGLRALRKLSCLSVLMVSTHRPVTKFFGMNIRTSLSCQSRMSTRGVSLKQAACSILVLL